MIISRVILKNWRNFRFVDVPLTDRAFLVGPNACGKSNFLDVFRFLRDIAKPGGGLQSALARRGGFSKIRCLSARKLPKVEIEVHLSDAAAVTWRYAIGIKQLSRGSRHTYLSYEKIWKDDVLLLDRPDENDKKDDKRLTQTNLEQIATNLQFRGISDFFKSVLYLHLVPQLIRHPEAFSGPGMPEDPFGKNFMERVAKTSDKTRKARLKKIGEALRIAVPQMKDLTDTKDELGTPHLEAVYQHWRPKAGKQQEDQFSDGTLRLIALLWLLLESNSLLLLEEPELSLNSSIIRELPGLIYRLQSRKKAKHRQLILSTHSSDLLLDKGIGGEEILLLKPGKEGTEIQIASSNKEIRLLLEGGLSVADAVLPHTAPEGIEHLELFS